MEKLYLEVSKTEFDRLNKEVKDAMVKAFGTKMRVWAEKIDVAINPAEEETGSLFFPVSNEEPTKSVIYSVLTQGQILKLRKLEGRDVKIRDRDQIPNSVTVTPRPKP